MKCFCVGKEGARCKLCGSRKVEIVCKVPKSVDGLFAKGKVGLKCKACGAVEYC